MKITVDGTVYDHDPDRLMVNEAIDVQEHTGLTMFGWQTQLATREPIAVKGLVYLLMKREDPSVDWDSLDFNLAKVDFEDDTDEDPTGAETSSSA